MQPNLQSVKNTSRKLRTVIGVTVGGALATVAAVLILVLADGPDDKVNTVHNQSLVSFAVLGDSDSHAYQDRISFESQPELRGGTYRSSSLSWTEVFAKLRGSYVDFGEWGIWGTRWSFARIREKLGMQARLPRKEDYRHNFAVSGAVCSDLMVGLKRQAPRLLALMDREPERWQSGVVVIRIGINNLGNDGALGPLARDSQDPNVVATITECVNYIHQAVSLIRSHHRDTRIVLVGIFDNAHWPKYLDRWQSAHELGNISAGLNRFDQALRAMAAADSNTVFFDDRAWFKQRWGERSPQGKPNYRDVVVSGFRVSNTVGDHPSNSVLADGHAGTVWSGLWVQSLIELLNERFDYGIPPLNDSEIAGLVVSKPR